ncbi:MAG TPA: lamin tail domain-containing protein, partial [Verrucomicrobiales bacterium]|nr:lamin tail domain-containing protein [Verrucomicrobiales bacterium]
MLTAVMMKDFTRCSASACRPVMVAVFLLTPGLFRAEVVINEIYSYPRTDVIGRLGPFENPALEFIELHNAERQPVNLAGWRLTGGVDYTFGAAVIGAGDYLVVAADPAAFASANPNVAGVVGGWEGRLRNSGETIRLRDAENTVVDEVGFADEGDWAVRVPGPLDLNHRGWVWSAPHDGGRKSLELTHPNLDNALGLAWRPSASDGGTPGRRNEAYAETVPPLITGAAHSPVVPSSHDSITVTARILAPASSSLSASLFWRIDGETDYRRESMFDDGEHGDGEPGDDRFGGLIPPQPDRSIVEFFIEARLPGGLVRRYPVSEVPEGSPKPEFLLQVYDGFVSEAAAAKTPLYLLIMTEVERAELETIGRVTSEAKSNAQMNATFVSSIGGRLECRYNTGVRNQGLTSRFKQPNSYRVNFRSDEPWNGLTAVAMKGRDGYRAIIGNKFYQLAGLPANDALPVRLRVNGTDLSIPDDPSYGHYAQIEAFDSSYTQNHFPRDAQGNLYSVIWRGLTYRNELRSYPNFYEKQTNSAEGDYSDLQRLGDVLVNAPGETFLAEFAQVADVDQCLRFFAVNAFLVNRESAITRGGAGDFALYRGVVDTRFRLLPKDLDSVLVSSPGVSLFEGSAHPQVQRFLEHPALVPRYYAFIRELAETVFEPAAFDRELDRMSGSTIPAKVIEKMKAFLRVRRDHVLSILPQTFTADSDLPVVNGLQETAESTATLRGSADVASTLRILVNGSEAAYAPITGEWAHESVHLYPGENRILVQAFGLDGHEVNRSQLFIRRETGHRAVLPAQIRGALTLHAEEGPYQIVDSVTVTAGGTLRIMPGTTIYVDPDRSLVVTGRLLAEGNELARIQLTRTPSEDDSLWNRINFRSGSGGNVLRHVDVGFAGSTGHDNIYLVECEARFEELSFHDTPATVLFLTRPQLVVRNSVFPELDAKQTVIGAGLAGDQYLIFDGNTFGGTSGYNDIIDWKGGKRPGPILQMYNNTFLGGSDEALDLDATDAHIEGNTFLDIRKSNLSTSTSNGISTGGRGGIGSDLTVVRNQFIGCDHALLLKIGSTAVFENNTVVRSGEAAINFGEPERGAEYGKGAVIRGSIFRDNPVTFQNTIEEVSLEVDQSNLPAEWHSRGIGNIDADPLFLDAANGDLRLHPESPSVGSGPFGMDMGAHTPGGVRIAGEPPPLTGTTNAVLTVGGPGIVSYRYALDDDSFSEEIPIASPIVLQDLSDGEHRVRAIGKNSAGLWQSEDAAYASRNWTVDSGAVLLRFNELYASGGDGEDFLELVNHGGGELALGGWAISDDPGDPRRYVILEAVTLGPGELLLIRAGGEPEGQELRLGFQFAAEGETVILFDPEGREADHLAYGLQAEGYSIGRNPAGDWVLGRPSPGSANSSVRLGSPDALRINEWLAAVSLLASNDYVELYNPLNLPVALGGLHLTDRPADDPRKRSIPPLSFIGPKSYAVFEGDDRDRPNGLGFALAAEQGWAGLADSEGGVIDQAFYYASRPDVPEGRTEPDDAHFTEQPLPTPGRANLLPPVVVPASLLDWDASWRIEDSGADLGADWRLPDYDDLGWAEGAGVIVRGDPDIAQSAGTTLTSEGRATTYFRVRFAVDGEPGPGFLRLRCLVDDGAVFYLNGEEIYRVRLPEGEVNFATAAESHTGPVVEEAVILPSIHLTGGENLLAVEVHQDNPVNAGLVLGAALEQVEEIPAVEFLRPFFEGLRITEIHFHPADDDGDTEFVELRNIGESVMNLEGIRFGEGIGYTFGPQELTPGARVVVAVNPGAFAARYGETIPVLGPYQGRLSNGGEALSLLLPRPWDLAILRFRYDDGWYPAADGRGFSLEAQWPYGSAADWNRKEGWRASAALGGSPGMPVVSMKVEGGLVRPGERTVVSVKILDEGLPDLAEADVLWTVRSGPGTVMFADPAAAETAVSFSLPGLYRLAATTAAGEDSAEFVVMETWEDWLARHFTAEEIDDPAVSGDHADPDGDGLSNLIEFALGL